MKPNRKNLLLSASAAISMAFTATTASALTYYWDNDGTTAGFGTAAGTWAAPTTGSATQGWSQNNGGTVLPVNVTTATTDTVNFGNGATGLAAGTITVSGTVSTGNMTFASGSGAITLSGGKITLGGSRTITANNTGNVISSELALTGATTFNIGEAGGAVTRQLTLGVLSGTGGTTFEYVGGSNGTGLILLNGASTYSGSTLISTDLTNANTEVRLGVDNALPTTTVLTIGGAAGTGSAPGRRTQLNLNGNDQTLAGLATTGGGSLRTQNVFSSTAATLTIDGSTSNTFAGLIGNGGTNITVIKDGSGIWTLSGANTYTGLTTVNGGAIRVQHASGLGATSGDTVVNGSNTGSAGNARVELAGSITVGAGESITINGTGNFLGALASFSGDNVWAGNVTIGTAGTRIGALNDTSLEVSGVIDSGAVNTGLIIRTTDLTGSVILSGANTYLGNTQVLIGKLQLAGGDNRLPVATNLILSTSGTNPDAEFDLNGRNQEVGGISNTGTVTKNSVNNSSTTLSTLTVNTAAAPSTYSGILKGNLALTKTGADTLTLTGDSNSYTGSTTVNGGTLLINGNSSTATGAVAVNAGTLGGSGRTGGAVTVSALATLSPGANIESLDVASLVMASTSVFAYQVADKTSTGADLLAARGTLSLTGVTLSLDSASQLALAGSTWTAGDKITLISYLGPDITSGFNGYADDSTVMFGSNEWTFNYNDTMPGGNFSTDATAGAQDRFVTLTALTVIPEPSAAFLGGLGALLLLRRRRA